MDESCANNSHNKTPNGHLIGYTSMAQRRVGVDFDAAVSVSVAAQLHSSLRNAILFNFCIFSINYFTHKSAGGHGGRTRCSAINYVAKALGEKVLPTYVGRMRYANAFEVYVRLDSRSDNILLNI